MIKRYALIAIIALTALVMMPACSSLSYLNHTLQGHWSVMSKREPLDNILSEATNTRTAQQDELVQQLTAARQIRDYASRELGLPDNGSYRSYADIGRPFVTWAVFAAPEFSLTPHHWCFPIAGCVPYRGYFSEEQANSFADKYRDKDMDVYVGGVQAYSTLGWFDDPLLNTMMTRGETGLAGLIFHELSHQQVYVKDDSAFNEAFATAVQESGVRRWLRHKNDDGALANYELITHYKDDFSALIKRTRQHLKVTYESDQNSEAKRIAKQQLIEHMRREYNDLKASWGGYSGYDHWFNDTINNAKLASISVYRDKVPQFIRLLEACSNDYPRFYKRVEEIGRLDPEQRKQVMENTPQCQARFD